MSTNRANSGTRWWGSLAILALVVPAAAAEDDAGPVAVTVQLRGALGEGSVKAFREALSKVDGITFDGDEIIKGMEPRFYSQPFQIEIADVGKTDVGAIAKAVVDAETPLRDEVEPGLNLLLYSPDEVGERRMVTVRDALFTVKGMATRDRRGVGGSPAEKYYWVKLDGSGKAKLSEILEAVRAAGIEVFVEKP